MKGSGEVTRGLGNPTPTNLPVFRFIGVIRDSDNKTDSPLGLD